ncbi:MAG: hypothetical protein L0958_06070, partial [Candidatus Mariimomonas ferrooxydans]
CLEKKLIILFDLALIESTDSEGGMATFKKCGKSFYSLVPSYTNDGGHLNEDGRRIVAEQLLIFLANLPDSADYSKRNK